MRYDVQIHGAGWAGLAIARGLRDAGATVRIVDPAGALGGASGRSLGLALPCHPEHPHRLEAGLGTVATRELLAFIRGALPALPGLAPTGVRWRASPAEVPEIADALAAAARIGLPATRTDDGYHLHDGGTVDLAELHATLLPAEVHATAEPAEIEVYATGPGPGDPWLADKVMPIRWQATTFAPAAAPLAHPVITQHGSVFWTPPLQACGARWATPHMEVGETAPTPDPQVTTMLDRLTREAFPDAGPALSAHAGIVGESCDGLPIVGPLPGRPRVVACVGFGISGLTYALPCARAVVAGLLGRPGADVPSALRVTRFR